MKDVKTLVIGARGMLGVDIMKAAQTRSFIGFDLDELDITLRDRTLTTIEEVRPDVIINAAAYTNVDGCESESDTAYAVNAVGAGHVAEAAAHVAAYLIHISTDYVFDGAKTTPYTEDDPVNPLGVYGASKAEGERLVNAALPENRCIVRTQWLYGVNGPNFVKTMLSLAQRTDTLTVVNDQFGSPTFTLDLAEALLKLIDLRPKGILNVTNSGVTSWFGFAQKIMEIAHIDKVTVSPMPSTQLQRPAPRPLNSALDPARYTALFGRPLRPWDESLEDYMRLETTNSL